MQHAPTDETTTELCSPSLPPSASAVARSFPGRENGRYTRDGVAKATMAKQEENPSTEPAAEATEKLHIALSFSLLY